MVDPDIEHIQELIDRSEHDSVTAERLTKTKIGIKRYRLNDDPIYRRLRNDEQPQFLFHANKETPSIHGPAAPDGIERSRGYRVMHLITDSRWLMIAGNKNGDQELEVQLKNITAVNYDSTGKISNRFSNNIFAFEIDGAHFAVPLSNDYNRFDLIVLSTHIRENSNAVLGGTEVDSDEAGYTIAGNDSIDYDAGDVRSRIDRLPKSQLEEANELLTKSNDVEELIPRLDELIEESSDGPRSLNEVVSDSSSVEELRRAVETPAERAQRRAKEHAGRGVERAKQTLEEADPQAVGGWGLNVGQAALPMAYAAPWSTPMLIAATMVLGGAAGVHASGTENSPLADIDPSELATHVRAMSTVGAELDNINGEVVGALLGAFHHLGGQLAPEEYAKWIVEADPEAIMAGADAGVAFAAQEEVDGTRREGAVVGAGLGLLGGYSGASFESDEFRDVVDSDLYKTYLEEHTRRGIELPD